MAARAIVCPLELATENEDGVPTSEVRGRKSDGGSPMAESESEFRVGVYALEEAARKASVGVP
jgi:hypothetical protein